MQQTETYKLNLIDKNDAFSPDPLNDNTRKLETQLNAVRAETAGADSALSNRVTALETHKIAVGTYIGSSAAQTIELGFRPKFVIIQEVKLTGSCFVVTAAGGCGKFTDSGFTITTNDYPNSKNTKFAYIAVK